MASSAATAVVPPPQQHSGGGAELDHTSPFALMSSGGGAAGESSPVQQLSPRRPRAAGVAAAAGAAAVAPPASLWQQLLACTCFAPAVPPAAPPPPPLAERRTLTKQVSLYAGPPRARSPSLPAAASSAFTDVEWFDAVSRFPGELSIALKSLVLPEEVADAVTDASAAATAGEGEGAAPAGAATADAAAGAVAAAPAPVAAVPRSISLKKAPYIPDPPLEMAGADFEFIPVPADTGFAGYWAKDAARCTPSPLPCDDALDASRLLRSAHETIPGIWIQETPTWVSITAKPKSIPLGPLSRYVETFNKDGSPSGWKLRRDLALSGRSAGECFFTADGTLIFRVFARPAWGDAPDFVTEDYIRLEDEGNVCITRQTIRVLATGRTATQYIVGNYAGAKPPPGH